MLSEREIERIHRQLENPITGNARRRLKKKLIEHDYATYLPPFTPFSHHRYYLNRFTNDQTLREIIEMAQTSSRFTLDTESVNVFQQPNRPSLIQIQILQHDEPSFVLILEMNHLPPATSDKFQQIRHICRIVLDPRKKIFIWGSINELQSFLPFRLFTSEEIALSGNEDLQQTFQEQWQESHVHQSIDCECEQCLGKLPTNTWSLQDAVAHQLHEWLDKRHTQSTFDIGLDPTFNEVDPTQRRLREQLSEYATNDCLAIEKLLSNMPQRRSSGISPTSTNYFEHASGIDTESITTRRHVTCTTILVMDSTMTTTNQIHRSIHEEEHEYPSSNEHSLRFDRNDGQQDDQYERARHSDRTIRIQRSEQSKRTDISSDRAERHSDDQFHRSERPEDRQRRPEDRQRPEDRPRRSKDRRERSEDRQRPEYPSERSQRPSERCHRPVNPSERPEKPSQRPDDPSDRFHRSEHRSQRPEDGSQRPPNQPKRFRRFEQSEEQFERSHDRIIRFARSVERSQRLEDRSPRPEDRPPQAENRPQQANVAEAQFVQSNDRTSQWYDDDEHRRQSDNRIVQFIDDEDHRWKRKEHPSRSIDNRERSGESNRRNSQCTGNSQHHHQLTEPLHESTLNPEE